MTREAPNSHAGAEYVKSLSDKHLIKQPGEPKECQVARWDAMRVFSDQEGSKQALRHRVTKLVGRAAKRVPGGHQVISGTSSEQWRQEGV